MDEVLKKELKLTRKEKIRIVVVLVLFVAVSMFAYFKLYFDVERIVKEHAVNNIENISQLNVDSVSRAIANRQLLLKSVSSRFTRDNIMEIDRILVELEEYVDSYDFYRLGVLDRENAVHWTNGTVWDASNMPMRDVIWDGQFHFSDSYMPLDGGKYAVNMFSQPIFHKGEIKYILIGTYASKSLTERMNISSMEGKGYTFLINEKSEVMIHPRYYEDETYNSLMRFIDKRQDILPNVEEDEYFIFRDESYYAHFEELGINDWYLMTCAREKDVFANAIVIRNSVLVVVVLLWVVLGGSVFFIAATIYQSKMDLKKTVFYDSLLNIGNMDFLALYYQSLEPGEYNKLYFIAFDINRFKEFNYIYGEEKGDNLLKYIVKVYQEEMPQAKLFRCRSDQFVLLDWCRNNEEYLERRSKIRARFHHDISRGIIQPFDTSSGIRIVEPGESLSRVMSDALIAKGTVKGNQVQQYAFYDEKIRNKRIKYMEMESDFIRALEEKEFHVYYQPKYDMFTGKIIGAEALARWIRNDGTMISPGDFIPCFEASCQISMLDEAMLRQVCEQMKSMEEDGIKVKKVSVNLSRVHLKHQGILPKIVEIIQETGVNPSLLSFEITESMLYEDRVPLKKIVDFLHGLGCKVDMDDYGAGVSGLKTLASNNFDVIKLDKSFIDGIGDQRMEAIIQSTIHLSKTLGIEILAEGVEERSQVDCLMEWGCNLAQGFYYSRPVPEEEYRRLLKEDAEREKWKIPMD